MRSSIILNALLFYTADLYLPELSNIIISPETTLAVSSNQRLSSTTIRYVLWSISRKRFRFWFHYLSLRTGYCLYCIESPWLIIGEKISISIQFFLAQFWCRAPLTHLIINPSLKSVVCLLTGLRSWQIVSYFSILSTEMDHDLIFLIKLC